MVKRNKELNEQALKMMMEQEAADAEAKVKPADQELPGRLQ